MSISRSPDGAVIVGGGGKVRIRSEANARSISGRKAKDGNLDKEAAIPANQGYSAKQMLSIFRADNTWSISRIKRRRAHRSTFRGTPDSRNSPAVLIEDGIGIKAKGVLSCRRNCLEKTFWDSMPS